MNIKELLDKITQVILKFSPKQYAPQIKIVVLFITLIAMILIFFSAFFSLVPQF